MTKILRELRRGELTTKDMSVLREGDSAKVQHQKTSGVVRDYTLRHAIRLGWGGNFAEENRIMLPFGISIDGRNYVLSWGELMDMDRGGFFRREEGNPRYYTLRHYDGPKFTFDTDLNDEATRDMIVRITTDHAEVLVDWYEMLRVGRFI